MQGFGSGPRSIAVEESADDTTPELLLEVEGEMRDAERVSNRLAPSTASGEQQALAPSVSGSAQSFRVTLEHVRAPLAFKQGGDGAVGPRPDIATRTRPFVGPASTCRGRGGARQRPVQSVGSKLSGMPLGGVKPPTASSTSSTPIRAASITGSPSTISATAAVAAACPAPLGIEAHSGDPPVLDRKRYAREIPTGRPAGRAREGIVQGRAQAGPRHAGSARKAPDFMWTG
jgi:hypothetical protein